MMYPQPHSHHALSVPEDLYWHKIVVVGSNQHPDVQVEPMACEGPVQSAVIMKCLADWGIHSTFWYDLNA